MLVITRRSGQAIFITTPEGRVIEIMTFIHGSQVKLSVKAPDDFLIDREEKIQQARLGLQVVKEAPCLK